MLGTSLFNEPIGKIFSKRYVEFVTRTSTTTQRYLVILLVIAYNRMVLHFT